jgi:hypothetical protein
MKVLHTADWRHLLLFSWFIRFTCLDFLCDAPVFRGTLNIAAFVSQLNIWMDMP